MEIKEFQNKSRRTAQFTGSEHEKVCNMCMGIAGESGEIIDYLKKVGFHGHSFDKQKLINEIGDLMWYITNLATYFNIDMAEVLTANIEKLKIRYPNGFSCEDSLKRVDIGGKNGE